MVFFLMWETFVIKYPTSLTCLIMYFQTSRSIFSATDEAYKSFWSLNILWFYLNKRFHKMQNNILDYNKINRHVRSKTLIRL